MSSPSGGTVAFDSSPIKAGNDVRVHIGNVTNVYHEGDAAIQPEVKSLGSTNELDNLLPPRPVHVLERDAHQERIVQALLSSPNTRVAILGMGGIGKTTLAASVMWDSRILLNYPRQYFISFEGLSAPDLVYSSLATTFEVPSDHRKSHSRILAWVMEYLGRERTLICVDNFESFWEVPASRRAADDMLAQLSSISTLAILVTLRGVQRPFKLSWLKLDPLEPLTQDGSIELLDQIIQEDFSEYEKRDVQEILDGVAGVPLAVTLVANLLSDGTESPHSLLRRWNVESTRAIGMDVEDRQYHLDVSLKLSIFGPRMTDDARAVLTAIAVLPAGLSSEDACLDKFQALLPPSIRLRDCLRSLQNTALCSHDKHSTPPRYQLLSPIRQFCMARDDLPLCSDATLRLIDLYTNQLDMNPNYASSSEYTWFTNELANITAILNFALSLPYITDSLGYACSAYMRWMDYLGSPVTDIICKAINVQPQGSKGRAMCLQAHAEILAFQGQYEEAMNLLQQALAIHRDAGDQVEEAWELMELGDIYRRLRRHDDAEGTLTKALVLYRGQDHQIGEANCLLSLSDFYNDVDRFSEAEMSAKRAIELYRSRGEPLGEANVLNTLGWAHRRQREMTNAVEVLTKAYEISEEIKYTGGQAVAMRYLGLVHEDSGTLDQAASCLQESVSLFEKSSDLPGARRAKGELLRVLSKLDPVVEDRKM